MISLKEFLIHRLDFNVWEKWHSTTQLFHILDKEGGLMVGFIGRQKHFQNDFDQICDIDQLKRAKLPHLNETKHNHY